MLKLLTIYLLLIICSSTSIKTVAEYHEIVKDSLKYSSNRSAVYLSYLNEGINHFRIN